MTTESDSAEARLAEESLDITEAEDFPEAIAEGVSQFLGKPRARGWIHLYSAIVAVIAGAALVSVSWTVGSTRAGIATLIYTCTIVAMFTVSATYHRVHWTSRRAHTWMKRLDGSRQDDCKQACGGGAVRDAMINQFASAYRHAANR